MQAAQRYIFSVILCLTIESNDLFADESLDQVEGYPKTGFIEDKDELQVRESNAAPRETRESEFADRKPGSETNFQGR